MNAEQVIEAIHGSYAKGSKNGLMNMHLLLDALHVQPGREGLEGPSASRPVPVIHVAGTNGKGSTCAMLESILRHAGYKTGLYTSPFLQAYHERIRLDGLPISDDKLVRYGVPLVDASHELEKQGVQVTPFEMGTALAISVFAGEQVDVAIVEVGLGGRLDPTNVVKPCLCAIGAIGLDHMNLLGDTLEEIAAEKAGIIKQGVSVVCHPADKVVADVFRRKAAEISAPLRQLTKDCLMSACCTDHGSTADYQLQNLWQQVEIPLAGEHQLTNAMVVLAMVEQLRVAGWCIPDEAVYEGIGHAVWPARLEWCGHVLLDGAHNPQGIDALKAFVDKHLPDKRRILLTGVLADKLQPDMLRTLCGLAEETVTVTPDNPRAMPAAELAARMNSLGCKAQAADTIAEGLERARMLAGEDGIILAAGSLYFAGSLRTLLGLAWR